jgi:hypothetical protein
MPPKARVTAQASKSLTGLQQKRKEREEKRALETPAKRVKKADPDAKEDASTAPKLTTPKKCVINLHDAVMKVPADKYINPTARKLFGDVEVLSA